MRTGTFYEVNISRNGHHVLATDSNIRQYDEFQALEVLNLLKERFAPEDGFEYSVTCWHVSCPSLPDTIKNAIPKSQMQVKLEKKSGSEE